MYFIKKNRNILENMVIERESRVRVKFYKISGILSSAGHEKSCVKLPGPSGKAKYSRETDSEPVLWRKGEKNLE